jgi:hypothetical protein
MECIICESEYDSDDVKTIPDKDGNPIVICVYCMNCANCDQTIPNDIDESSWILTGEPCFPSGWAFMTKEELNSQTFYIDRYALLCDECKLFRCNTCTNPKVLPSGVKLVGMCANLCRECGWSCDDDECSCTK